MSLWIPFSLVTAATKYLSCCYEDGCNNVCSMSIEAPNTACHSRANKILRDVHIHQGLNTRLENRAHHICWHNCFTHHRLASPLNPATSSAPRPDICLLALMRLPSITFRHLIMVLQNRTFSSLSCELWVLKPCSNVVRYQCFRGPCFLYLQPEDGGTNITTWCHNPQDHNLILHCSENLKSSISNFRSFLHLGWQLIVSKYS